MKQRKVRLDGSTWVDDAAIFVMLIILFAAMVNAPYLVGKLISFFF
jgi:hypothetical protein